VKIALVAAVAENGVIGREGGLPWRLPEDLKFFKRLTTGHTVIMGRRTWDELGKPLPNRRNIVVTRNRSREFPGAERAASLAEALALASGDDQVFIIGGGEIYRQALPLADRMYLTHVHAVVEGDTFFPEWDRHAWRVVEEQGFAPDERHAHGFSITAYARGPA
jgi:dihydrofolate reductase